MSKGFKVKTHYRHRENVDQFLQDLLIMCSLKQFHRNQIIHVVIALPKLFGLLRNFEISVNKNSESEEEEVGLRLTVRILQLYIECRLI